MKSKISLLIFSTLLLTYSLTAQIPTTNLQLWLRADAGLTTTAGNAINSGWTDQSPNGLVLSRSGNPILMGNAINGRPAVRFINGQSFTTNNAAVTSLPNITYFVVCKFGMASTEVFNKSNQYGLYAQSNNSARFFTNSIYNNELQYNVSSVVGVYNIYRGRYDLSQITGAANTTVSSPVNLSSAIPTGSTLYVGGGWNFWFDNGELAELIIYNTALNASDIDAVYAYLSAKYNIGFSPNAPSITNFGTKEATFEPLFLGTKVAASGFGSTGDVVTVIGNNFSSVTGVTLNNLAMTSYTVNSNNMLSFSLPDGLANVGKDFTGRIRLINSFGTGMSAQDLQVIYTNFTPSSTFNAVSGGKFSIAGTDVYQISAVSVGGVSASFAFESASNIIKVNISTTLGLGNKTIHVSQNTYLGNFVYDLGFPVNVVSTIPSPFIANINPTHGDIGSTLIINGVNFGVGGHDNVVQFGSVRVLPFYGNITSAHIFVPTGISHSPINLVNLNSGLSTKYYKPFITTFAGGANISSGTFAPPVFPSASYTSYQVKFADLNNDGKPEVITPYYNSSYITINVNAANNTITAANFSSTFTVNCGNNPYDMEIADIDNDGRLDIILANYSSSFITILKNNYISGTLQASNFSTINVASANNFYGIAVGDIDMDGKQDLVGARATDNNIYVYKNNFTIGTTITASSFGSAVIFGIGAGTTPYDVDLTDLNNDGKPELVSANNNQASLSIFENIATLGVINSSSFSTPFTAPLASGSVSVNAADFDGDGKTDLVATNYSSASVSVIRNKHISGALAAAQFNTRVDFAAGTTPYKLAVGDLNGDGKVDIAVSNFGSNTISLFANNAVPGTITSASFASKIDYSVPNSPTAAAIADLDGDGKPDVACATYYGFNIAIFRNLITPPPVITSFAPASGLPLSNVTIFGSNFSNVAQIALGTTLGSNILANEANYIVAKIPAFSSTNFITLTNGSGSSATSTSVFSITGATPLPVITSVSPINTTLGGTVIIQGSGFEVVPELNLVWFGATRMPVLSSSATQMVVSVIGGGSVSVINYQNGFGLNTQWKLPFAYTFANGNFVPSSFTNNATFATSSQPYNILAADFDGDGKPDIMATAYNASTNQISIAKNNAINNTITGSTFAAPFVLQGYTWYCFQSSVGDLDGDGKLDIVIPNTNTNYFTIYKNISSPGTLTASSFGSRIDINVTAGYSSYGSAIADIDNDGNNDVIFTSNNSNRIFIYRNLGTGNINNTLQYSADFATGTNPSTVKITDVDGDGKKDIVIGYTSSAYVSVYRNVSTSGTITSASFAPRVDLPTANACYSIAIADINSDGKPEILAANYTGNFIHLFQNNNMPGTVTSAMFARVDLPTNAGSNPYDINAGDLDGDGKPEIIMGGTGNTLIAVYKNNYLSGNILAANFTKSDIPNLTSAYGIEVADLDLDGKLEILAANGANNVKIYKNQIGNGLVPTITGFSPASGTALVTWVTVTGFGFTSISGVAIASVPSPQYTVINANTLIFKVPNATITGKISIANQFGTLGISATDFTVTGLAPLPVITSFTPSKGYAAMEVSILGSGFDNIALNNVVHFGGAKATITGASANLLQALAPWGATFDKIRVTNLLTNFSGESTMPFVTTFAGPRTITSATFAPKVDLPSASNVYATYIADIDGDGKNDLLAANYNLNTFSIFRNTGTGINFSNQFAPKVDFTTGSTAYKITVADLDGDGKNDIIVPNYSSNTISVFRNLSNPGSIFLSNKVDFSVGSNPVAVEAADIDSDGLLDLVIANYNVNYFTIYKNTGITGTITSTSFGARQDIVNDYYAYAIAIGDLDRDGKPDIATTTQNTNIISIYRNLSTQGAITLAPRLPLTSQFYPWDLKFADLDYDNILDMVASNPTYGTVSVFRNTGLVGTITSASFAARVDFNTLASNNYLALADIDGDGRVDISNSGFQSPNYFISVLRNVSTGAGINTGSFATNIPYIVGTQNPYIYALGDLNNDSKPDLAVPQYGGATISLLKNLSSSEPTVTGFNPSSGQAGIIFITITGAGFATASHIRINTTSGSNINIINDNFIIARLPINATTGAVAVLNGFGLAGTVAGIFTVTAPFPYPSISGIVPAKGEKNATVTVIGANFGSNIGFNNLWFGASQATITGANANEIVANVPNAATYDRPTLLNTETSLFTYYNTPYITTFAGSNSILGASFASETGILGGISNPYFSVVKDLDGDGKPEVVTANYGSNTITISRNVTINNTITSSSFVNSNITNPFSNPIGLAVGDIDNDGKPDIIVTNSNNSSISIYKNNFNSGTISSANFSSAITLPVENDPRCIAIGDLDKDGYNDLVVGNFFSNSLSIFKNRGQQGNISINSFEPAFNINITNRPNSVAIGDLDADTKPDIVVGMQTGLIVIIKNNSQQGTLNSSSFEAPINQATTYTTFNIAIGDINDDGKPEIIGGSTSAFATILQNTTINNTITGTSFSNIVYLNTSGSTYNCIALGDFNGDGKVDIAGTAYSGTNRMYVFQNNLTTSTITAAAFGPRVDYAISSNPIGINVSDLDGDAKPDVIVTSYNNNRLSIYKNLIVAPPTITGMTPLTGTAGITVVSVSGGGFANVNVVGLGNSAGASFTILGNNNMLVKVPPTATIGALTVNTNLGGLAYSNEIFTVTGAFPYPSITGVSPLFASSGETISVFGTNFDATLSNNRLYFGAVKAMPNFASPNLLTALLPPGATHDNVRYMNDATMLQSASARMVSPTFTGMNTITGATYAAAVNHANFTSGNYKVLLGDVDGDGKVDAVTNTYTNNNISIFRNISSAGTWTGTSLATRIDISIAGAYYMWEMELEDIDMDGKLDIIFVDGNGARIGILKNNSSPGSLSAASFSAPVFYTGTPNPYALEVADFDNDGLVDIAAMNGGGITGLYIYKNLGITGTITSASFAPAITIPTSYSYAYELQAADFDYDGRLDMVAANYGNNGFTIFKNIAQAGVISFVGYTYNTGYQAISCRVGDIDKDGRADIALSNNTSTLAQVYKNNSLGGTLSGSSFSLGGTFTAGSGGYGVELFDLDGDSWLDMVIANYSSNNISIFRNNRVAGTINGTSFSPKVDYATSSGPSYPRAADMDLDGKPDIIIPYIGAAQLTVFRNALVEIPTVTGFTPTSGTPLSIISITGASLGTVNNVYIGGAVTNIITSLGANALLARVPVNAATGLVVVSNTQGSTSTAPGIFTVIPIQYPTITGIAPLAETAGNIIQIFGNNFSTLSGSNILGIGAVNATVTGATATQLTATIPMSADYKAITLLNNESGFRASYTIPLRLIFPSSGTILGSSMAPKVDYIGLSQPYYTTQKDLNGDGKPEILTANYGSNYVTIFNNQSINGTITGSSFSSFNILPGFNNPLFMAAEDLDNDSKPDLAVVDYFGNRIAIYKNIHTGGALSAASFSGPIYFATASRPYTLAIADFDYDGFNDIAVANNTGFNVSVFKNNITPGVINASTFAPKVDFTVATAPIEITAADIDNDGRIDIVTSNDGTPAVSILKNITNRGIINSGSFATHVSPATAYGGYGLGIGDLNNDGKLEIVAASSSSSFVMVFQNNTSGNTITGTSFVITNIAAPIYGYRSVKIADLDGDGKNEMVVPTTNPLVSVYRNITTGLGINTGSFSPAVTYTTGNYPWGLSLGDLDGDGKPEIVTANYSSNSISILKNLQSNSNLPTINNFVPASARRGKSFTITGTNFIGVSTVQLGGVSVPYTVLNVNNIVATLPGTAITGSVYISAFGGNVTSASNFVVDLTPAPSITGINPTSVLQGGVVTITGTELEFLLNPITISGITINNYQYNPSLGRIIATVPGYAVSGDIRLATSFGGISAIGSSSYLNVTPMLKPSFGYTIPAPIWDNGSGVTYNASGTVVTRTLPGADFGANIRTINMPKSNGISISLKQGISTNILNFGIAEMGNFGAPDYQAVIDGSNVMAVRLAVVLANNITSVSPDDLFTVRLSPSGIASILKNGVTVYTFATSAAAASYSATLGIYQQGDSFHSITVNNEVEFSQNSAFPGTVVSVFGNNFVSVSGVAVSGVNSTFNVQSSTLLLITVPSVITGKVTVTNYSGSTQSATNLQVLTPTSPNFGQMLVMDGADNQIAVPHDIAINFTNGFTIEAMVKFNQITRTTDGYDWQAIFTKSAYSQAYGLMLQTEGSKLLRFYLNGCTPSTVTYDWSSNLLPNIWYHVAVSYDGVRAKIYIDGVEVLNTPVSGNVSTNTNSLIFGASPGNGPYPLDGNIDEVRVWNFARSISGINANRCDEIFGNEPGLVAYYRFNEINTSVTALDHSPSRLLGNLNNFTLPSQRVASTALCYAPATITAFNPTSGNAGSTYINITGTGFTAVTQVAINNVNLPYTVLGVNNIVAFIPISVTSGFVVVRNNVFNTTSTGIFTVIPQYPVISNISPSSQREGRGVTLAGLNFAGVTQVKAGGNVNAPFAIFNTTLLGFTVPGGALTGPVTVTNFSGIGESSTFTVLPTPAPSVTGVSPAYAVIGNQIIATVQEIEFLQGPITFGGITIGVFTNTGSALIFNVPFGANSGDIRIKTLYGGISQTSAGTYLTVLPPPIISDFGNIIAAMGKSASGGCGSAGDIITILGNNFAPGLTDVYINNFNSINPTVTSSNLIYARVPDLVGSPGQNITGKIKVQTPAGQIQSVPNLTGIFCASSPTTTIGLAIGAGFEIEGNDLLNINGVTVAGANATFNYLSGSLNVVVPNGANTGNISVTLRQSSYYFTFPFSFYIYPRPTISGIMPLPAAEGSTISIVGSALDSVTGVAFVGATQTIVSNINTNLVTLSVPDGVQNGFITLYAGGGSALSPVQFLVAPTITGLTPVANGVGKPVYITGKSLNGITQILFNGTNGSIVSKTNTNITVNVPSGATTGNLWAIAPMYTSPGIFFTVLPQPMITNIAPGSGPAGTIISVIGENFTMAGTNQVTFNGGSTVNATLSGTNVLLVEVPATALTGYISVNNNGGSATSAIQFAVSPSLTGLFTPSIAGAGAIVTIFGKNLSNPNLVRFNGFISTNFSSISSTAVRAAVPVLAGSGAVLVDVTTDGGQSNGVVYTILGAPTIASATPGSGIAGTVVTLTGTNYLTNNIVYVNNAFAPSTFVSSTKVLVTVPGNVSVGIGNIQLQNQGNVNLPDPANYTNSPGSFSAIPHIGTITGGSPLFTILTQARQGDAIRLTGTNYLSGAQVFFNGLVANAYSVSSNQLYVVVPTGAASGNVTVRTSGGTSSPVTFNIIPPPSITSFNPTSGVAGTWVTITGVEFNAVTNVTFGSVSSVGYTVVNSNTLVASVPGTTGKGKISISAAGGVAQSSLDFVPTPVITSINYTEAPINSYINIAGTNLHNATDVKINGVEVVTYSNFGTSVSILVPNNATSGYITLTSEGGNAISPYTFTVSTITSINPTSGIAGSLVTVSGIGLSSVTSYNFDGATSFNIVQNMGNMLIVSVPGTAEVGSIRLNFPNSGQTSSSQIFNPSPVITSISPYTHGTSQFINLTGTNLREVIHAEFNGVPSSNLGSASGSNRNNVQVPANALSGIISVTVSGGGTASSPLSFTVISISGVFPAVTLGGSEITITGANLDSPTAVTIGGTTVAGINAGSTSSMLITTVPSSISSAQIIVYKGGGYNDSYSINLPNATITSVNPTVAGYGSILTINGFHFTNARNVWLYNASHSPFSNALNYQVINSNLILATVTSNAVTGNVRVQAQNNNITTGGQLIVLPPTLNPLPHPEVLPAGQSVVLNGNNLTSPATLSVGGAAVTISSYGENSITFTMPTTTGSNMVTVQNAAGLSSVTFSLFSITSLSTTAGVAGSIVSISGTSMSSISGVRFNGVSATYAIISDNQIIAYVPDNAGNGLVSVQAGSYSINASPIFNPIPVITGYYVYNGLDASTAISGSRVSLTGTNLNNVNSVILGGGSSAYVSFIGCTGLCCTGNASTSIFPLCAPSNAQSGTILASNGLYTASFGGFNFVGPPVSISGVVSQPGATVTIFGAMLNTVTAVSFGGVPADFFTQFGNTIVANISFNSTISGSVSVLTRGGNVTSAYTAPPIITSFNKIQGAIGIDVRVNGLNLSGISQVVFNGITASGTNFGSYITVNVPAGATTGYVNISNAAGTAISPDVFSVIPMPSIVGFNPSQGGEGTLVLIDGFNLENINAVSFANGSQSASITGVSATQISVIAPNNVNTGKIVISNTFYYPGTIQSSADFVAAPEISSVINISNNNAPYIGKAGEIIRINGINYTNPSYVSFNGVMANTAYNSNSQLTATVPSGATSGIISITTSGGNVSSTANFDIVDMVNVQVSAPNSCAGANYQVLYTVTGLFPSDNIFYVDIMNGGSVVSSNVASRNSNTSSIIYSILPGSLIGTYQVRVRSASISTGYQLISANSNSFGITNVNGWLGGDTGGADNWNIAANWGCNMQPTSGSYVVIPSVAPSGVMPVIYGSASAGSIFVNGGGSVNLTTSGLLTLHGGLTLPGTYGLVCAPNSFVFVNAIATFWTSINHVEVGNLNINNGNFIKLESPLKVKGSLVNNSTNQNGTNAKGLNTNGFAVTVEGTAFQAVGTPNATTTFDELYLNNNVTGAGVALAGAVQVKCKFVNMGIFYANGFLTEFINSPCTPIVQGTSNTEFHDIAISNTVTAVSIQSKVKVRGNFVNQSSARGVVMTPTAGIEFSGNAVAQTIEANGQTLQYNDLVVNNPMGVSLTTTFGNNLIVSGNFVNNGVFTDPSNTLSFTGSNTSISGTGIFNLNNIELTSAAGISVVAPVNVKGNIKVRGNFKATGQTLTMNATGSQTIESVNNIVVSLAGLNIAATSTVTSTAPLAVSGHLQTDGNTVLTVVDFVGTSPQIISGAGNITIGGLNNNGMTTLGIATSIEVTGNVINNAPLEAQAGTAITFAGTNQTIGGAVEPVLNNVSIAPASTVTLTRSIRTRGNFNPTGTFVPNNQTVTFAASGSQNVESTHVVSFAGIQIESTSSLTINTTVNISGSVMNTGNVVINEEVKFASVSAQTIGGTGDITLSDVKNMNTSTDGVIVQSAIEIQGNIENNGKLDFANTLTLTGASQTVSGTAEISVNNVAIANTGSVTLRTNTRVRGNFVNNSQVGGLQALPGAVVSMEGTSTQTIGGSTPTTFGGLNISNAAGVEVSHSLVTHNLTMAGGVVDLPASEKVTVTNPAANAVVANDGSFVNGTMTRSVENNAGSYTFPVGTNDVQTIAKIDINTTLAGVSNIQVSSKDTLRTNALSAATPIVDNGTRLETTLPATWKIEPNVQPATGTYNVTLEIPVNSVPGADTSGLAVVKRPTPAAAFVTQGTKAPTTTRGNFVQVKRNNISSFSEFAIAGECARLVASTPKPVITKVNNDTQLDAGVASKGYDWKYNGTSQSSYATQVITPTASGDYSVRVLANGCFSLPSDPVSFTVATVPGPLPTVDGLNLSKSFDIHLYPNPAKKYVVLELINAKDGKYVVSFHNIIGNEVMIKTISADGDAHKYETFGISELKPGIYFVKVTYGSQVKVHRLVVD
ncbi:MAG: FG-GAP-like repeat-containing protein [Cytophagales bacterium]|nr:FG-GAP-like repeat-containing protein [Cytophagales bacterium]